MKNKLLIYILVSLITGIILVTISTEAKAITSATSDRPLAISTGQILGLAISCAFSPGISLLQIAYHTKMDQSQMVTWWLLAGINFLVDKIPVLASKFQVVEHPIIWYTAYKGATCLGGSPQMWALAALIGSCVLFVRQIYTVGTDITILGAPVRGFVEDIIGFLLVLVLLSLITH